MSAEMAGAARRRRERVLLTGNHAVAWGARLARPKVIPVYPITPQTPVLELLTEFHAAGELDAEMLTPESEHSVMAACIPASLAGVRVFTATASQGLMLMHELLHYASGARAPIVMANVNRTIASPWAFWPDQTDSLAQRDTGWMQLYVESAQEALDSVIQAYPHRRAGVPAGDGQPGRVLRLARARAGGAAGAGTRRRLPAALRAGALPRSGARRILGQCRHPGHVLPPPPRHRRSDGPGAGGRRSRPIASGSARTGRGWGVLERYRCDGAQTVIVTLGSMCGTAREAVDALRDAGEAVGLLKVRLFRPLPVAALRAALAGVRDVLVLDRNFSPGAGGVLHQELRAALYGMPDAPRVHGLLAGVGGVNVPPQKIVELARRARASRRPNRYGRSADGRDCRDDLLCSGHAACPGCIEALSARHVLSALGPDTVAVIPPSCMAIIAGAQPLSALRIPVYQPPLATSAAAASGLRRALDARGKKDTQVVVFAGDGGTYDIGLQCLSSAAERNENILYVCFDNEGYMNTGAQKSSSTPHFARTGSTPAGKPRKKNLIEIMAAHEMPYAATATAGFLPDFVRKVEKAKAMRGFRLIMLLVPCLDGWGVPEDQGIALARLAVESGVFPLYEVEDGRRYTLNGPPKTRPVRDYLRAQRRYRGLDESAVQTLQSEVDEGWERLLARV